jgi:hypothetical protein
MIIVLGANYIKHIIVLENNCLLINDDSIDWTARCLADSQLRTAPQTAPQIPPPKSKKAVSEVRRVSAVSGDPKMISSQAHGFLSFRI